MVAEKYGSKEVAEVLLAIGVDVNGDRHNVQTALQVVATGGYLEVVKTICAAGADLNDSTDWILWRFSWPQRQTSMIQ